MSTCALVIQHFHSGTSLNAELTATTEHTQGKKIRGYMESHCHVVWIERKKVLHSKKFFKERSKQRLSTRENSVS